MAFWQIQGQMVRDKDGWCESRQVPTFFLLDDVQGITDGEHACKVARRVVDLEGQWECHLTAVKLLPGNELADEETYRAVSFAVEGKDAGSVMKHYGTYKLVNAASGAFIDLVVGAPGPPEVGAVILGGVYKVVAVEDGFIVRVELVRQGRDYPCPSCEGAGGVEKDGEMLPCGRCGGNG